jgi:fluorothreonine transaldolase
MTPPHIQEFIERILCEEERNRDSLFLTANEPQMSETARSFLSLELGDRYYSGGGDEHGVVTNAVTPFTTRGLSGMAALVDAASSAARAMLGAAAVNIGCLSGVHAMMCAILSLTEPGDTVMTIAVPDGGHFGTEGILLRAGRGNVTAPFDPGFLTIDLDRLGPEFHAANARALYLNASFYLHPHDLRGIREAVGEDAVVVYDASHTMGLIMGGEFQAPLMEGADVICGNTHKTLPGPQKGMIAFRDAGLADAADAIIENSFYSSVHTMPTAALAITILEMRQFGGEYARQVVANSNALGEALTVRGFELRRANTGRFSENHQVHLFTDQVGDHYDLYLALAKNNIAVNFDNALGGRTYIRLGTQEITRRGMTERDMGTVADLLTRALGGAVFPQEVATFMAEFRQARFSFDVGAVAERAGRRDSMLSRPPPPKRWPA